MMPETKPVVSVVVPLYNEEQVITECYRRLTQVLEDSGESYELIFVNDGSRDATWPMAVKLAEEDGRLRLLSFARNFGHQVAITAGMDASRGDAVIVIDADLQDPPELLPEMLAKWREGYEVVYGKRVRREGDGVFKRLTASLFYRFINLLSDTEIPRDVGDFRLLDRKVCDVLRDMPERNRYVRGLVSWVGYRQTAVEFVRAERFAGETKYPLRKMLRLAGDGIISFSNKPLKLSTGFGVFISLLSFIYLIVIILQRIFTDTLVSGWASLACLLLFLNGILMIMLGIMGQYIGRIYDETKGRPYYIIARKVNFHDEGA